MTFPQAAINTSASLKPIRGPFSPCYTSYYWSSRFVKCFLFGKKFYKNWNYGDKRWK
jgi:hypothetical protein